MSDNKWKRINSTWSYCEIDWKPDSWSEESNCRMIAYRQKVHELRRGSIQLDLFKPFDEHYDFKVISTSIEQSAKKVLEFHNGRGTQEKIFSELKSDINMDRIATRTLAGNRIYLTSTILAYNINREIQIEASSRTRKNSLGRKPLWNFITLRIFRQKFIQRAGRLIKPQGKWVLEMNETSETMKNINRFLNIFPQAA